MYESSHDPRGNETTRRFLDAAGHPVRSTDGIGGYSASFDLLDREIERRFFDENGKPALSGRRYAGYKTEYDDAGDVVALVWFDAAGKTVQREQMSTTTTSAPPKPPGKPHPPQPHSPHPPPPNHDTHRPDPPAIPCDQLVAFAQVCFEQSIMDIECNQLYTAISTSIGKAAAGVCMAICQMQRSGVQWPTVRSRVQATLCRASLPEGSRT